MDSHAGKVEIPNESLMQESPGSQLRISSFPPRKNHIFFYLIYMIHEATPALEFSKHLTNTFMLSQVGFDLKSLLFLLSRSILKVE